MSAKYQVPLRDGNGGMMDVTVKGLRVYDANGKDLGSVKLFPGLKRVDGTGTFFDGAKGGKYDTETAETPAPGGGAADESTRVSPTGMRQSGKQLGLGDINGLFASLSNPERKGGAKMTAGDLPSASNFFSEALVTTPQSQYQGGELKISTDDTGYEVGAPVSKGTKIDGSQVTYQNVPGYEVPETSVPMTTGRDGNDASGRCFR